MENFSIEHEMSVIGSALLSMAAAKDLSRIIAVHHFWRPAHRIIWAGITDLLAAKRPIDIELLLGHLKSVSRAGVTLLEGAGGEEYMIELAQFVPSPANALYYAEVVIDFSIRRAYIGLGKDADAGKDLEELRSTAKIIAEAGNITAVHDGFQIGTIGTGKVVPGITTGFKAIDSNVLGGGWVRGQQSTVAARQKGGKSAWLVASAIAGAFSGANVVFATFADLSARNIQERVLKQLSGFSHEPSDPLLAEKWHTDMRELAEVPITVYEPRKMGFNRDLETFERWLRARHEKRPIDLVLVDYAQKLWMQAVPRHESYRQAEACSDFIDDMAREFTAAFVVGSQITLHGDGMQEMTKGSRIWEENTALLVKPKIVPEGDLKNLDSMYRDLKGISRVEVPLNRFGPPFTTWATWNERHVRYDEVI